MSQIISRCSNLGSEIIGYVKIGSSSVSLISNDKVVKGILNGCEIFKTVNLKEAKDSVAGLLSDLILNIHEKEKPENFTIFKQHWASEEYPTQKIAEQIIDNLKKNIKFDVKVRAKEASVSFEPELNIKGDINPEILSKNAKVLNRKLATIIDILQNTAKNANIIVNHNFESKTAVWGVHNVQKIINGLRDKIKVNASEIYNTDFYKEMLEKTIQKFSSKLSNEINLKNPEEKKIVSEVVIPEILNNYEKIKSLASCVVLDIVPLVYIDKLFKKNTSYPANYFISCNVIEDLKDDYDFLINFLQELPRIESNAIVPLELYKNQINK